MPGPITEAPQHRLIVGITANLYAEQPAPLAEGAPDYYDLLAERLSARLGGMAVDVIRTQQINDELSDEEGENPTPDDYDRRMAIDDVIYGRMLDSLDAGHAIVLARRLNTHAVQQELFNFAREEDARVAVVHPRILPQDMLARVKAIDIRQRGRAYSMADQLKQPEHNPDIPGSKGPGGLPEQRFPHVCSRVGEDVPASVAAIVDEILARWDEWTPGHFPQD